MTSKNTAKIELALTSAKNANTELTRATREHKSAMRAYENLQKRLDGALATLQESTATVEAKLKQALAAQKTTGRRTKPRLAKAPKAPKAPKAAKQPTPPTVTARTTGKIVGGKVQPKTTKPEVAPKAPKAPRVRTTKSAVQQDEKKAYTSKPAVTAPAAQTKPARKPRAVKPAQ